MAEAAASIVSGHHQAFAVTDLGLQRLALAAALVPTWEYALLLTILGTGLLYYVLGFHIVGDILRGWKGDTVGLYYDPRSPVSAQLLAKCEILKQRYWPTPWLCSPHLQTLFLHFFGRSPRVDYQRQLYITSDGGTIALDWVKLPTFTEDAISEDRRKNPALDETPTAIIVPGLTSDSHNHYVRHIAGSFSDKGWRVLVANHRGLGGVSITSDQFYNAGWTDDIRKIILLVQQTYPKSPLLAIGTSIGANILVKYLGEEGPRTPLGGAVAICCPWDLLVCDRFMARTGVQSLYNKALATGLQQYAQLHQTALSRMVDWDLLKKSASIRDFDKNCTRHVGEYETVDTYYRRCSSAQFVEAIAVPLLCVSAADDPICTKEAIPYDECSVNPNIILGVSGHGGHLAYFEGLDASSIWWVRAATEFARVLLSSSLMHQQSKGGAVPSTKLGADIDKGPFLTMAEGLTAATQDSGNDSDFLTGAQENQGQPSVFRTSVNQRENDSTVDKGPSVTLDKSIKLGPCLTADDVVTNDCGGPVYRPVIQESEMDAGKANNTEEAPVISNDTASPLISTSMQHEVSPSVTLQLRSSSELAALRSALSQLLDQVPSSIVEETHKNELESGLDSRHTNANRSQTIDVPINPAVIAGFGNCVEATEDLLVTNNMNGKITSMPIGGHSQRPPIRNREDISGRSGPVKDLAGLASQNRRTLWLLTNAWRHYVVSNRLQHLQCRFERVLALEVPVLSDLFRPICKEPTEGLLLGQEKMKADPGTAIQIVMCRGVSDVNIFPETESWPSDQTFHLDQSQPKEVPTLINLPEPEFSPTTDEPHLMESPTCTEGYASRQTCDVDSTDPSSSDSTGPHSSTKAEDVDSNFAVKPVRSRGMPFLDIQRTLKAPSPSTLLPSPCISRKRNIPPHTRMAVSKKLAIRKENVF